MERISPPPLFRDHIHPVTEQLPTTLDDPSEQGISQSMYFIHTGKTV